MRLRYARDGSQGWIFFGHHFRYHARVNKKDLACIFSWKTVFCKIHRKLRKSINTQHKNLCQNYYSYAQLDSESTLDIHPWLEGQACRLTSNSFVRGCCTLFSWCWWHLGVWSSTMPQSINCQGVISHNWGGFDVKSLARTSWRSFALWYATGVHQTTYTASNKHRQVSVNSSPVIA